MTTRAAIYTRVSLDRDGTSESPERQQADCEAVAARLEWEVVDRYVDRESAYSESARRPEYERMLRDLRSGRINGVIIWKLDRLSRKGTRAIWKFLNESDDLRLVSATEATIDTDTSTGRIVLSVLAEQAHQESENTSLRVLRAHDSSAAKGRMHTGGNRPYGYTRAGEIVPEEAEVIRECAKRVMAGESLRSIATDLNKREIRTSAAGETRKLRGKDKTYVVKGEWRSVTLSQVLRSPTIAGKRRHNGDVHQGDWEPILGEDEHAELLRVLASRRSDETAQDRSHLLSGAGVIRCDLCGQAMRRMSFRMKNGRIFHRYQCLRQPGQNQCGRVAITQASTDAFVVGELLDFLDYAELRPLEGDESEAELEARLVEARAAVTELIQERFVKRSISREDYEQTLGPLQTTVTGLESRLGTLRRARDERAVKIPLGDREALGAWWEAATDAEKIATVRWAIRGVRVRRVGRSGGNKFDPSRLAITWNWETFRLTEQGRRLERFWAVGAGNG